ncbi:MAG TPA: GNAT family N-acetyltransferase [Candidatus Acidoferrum sp.]|nr:GNAT family N-acetyltransferase [Candidatus Acidoferrum sp.]
MNPLLLNVPAQITTKRLLLRPVTASDAAMMNDAIQQSFAELCPWMPWAGTRPTLESTRDFCAQAEVDFAVRREFPMLMLRREDGLFLGGAGLVRGDWTVPKFEVGYWIRTTERGHGYVAEAVDALVRFARRHLKIRRLEVRTDSRNTRSANVAKRAGFKLEGKLRYDGRDNRNRLRDTLLFARTF